ncbi:hypothetical protein BGZ99_003745 [Dissophora globulifera]|uniref:Formin GTPase-binding domain-containing protein n=1 Tax=Dissophora globulifera TaxID=979702 RepID=A0A9P6UVX7_9FUNG|nr:hypothetical protein BGZ99_003745 [Dissophora globulifera]
MATSTPKDNNNTSRPSSAVPPRSGAPSPDLKKGNRISALLDDYTSSNNRNSVHNNNSNNNNGKDKEKKKPFVKMDLFNLKSRNAASSSQANLLVSSSGPAAADKSLPGPPPPSKETFWRGIGRSNVCVEDDYSLLAPPTAPPLTKTSSTTSNSDSQQQQPQQQQQRLSPASQAPPLQGQLREGVGAEYAAVRGFHPNFGSDFVVVQGHTDNSAHELHDDNDEDFNKINNREHSIKIDHQHRQQHQHQYELQQQEEPQQQHQVRVASPEPFERYQRPTSPTPPRNNHQFFQRQQFKSQELIPSQQLANRLPTTMSEDLSRLSISNIQDGSDDGGSVRTESLQMEDYDLYSMTSSADSSLQSTMRFPEGHLPLLQHHPYQLENKPLSALERIQQQQRRHSQEQERLVDLVVPANQRSAGAAAPSPNILPVRDLSKHNLPIQSFPLTPSSTEQHQHQQLGEVAAESESLMLDQLLTLAAGPNRPRLPSQIEWERGFEELRQKRKEAAAMERTGQTSSVGRQNSGSSRHSQGSSDGKSRRHSMPDMPHGQTREDLERQRGDNFRNPMLLSSSGATQRRSFYEDREQQLHQPPIQRQSIAESQAMDGFPMSNLSADPQQIRNSSNNNSNGRRAVSPTRRMRECDKDVVDIAFDDMLTSLSIPDATRAQLESLPKERKWAMLQSNDANPTLYQTPQTMPPQYFVEALREYTGKKKRSSRDLSAFNPAGLNPTSNKSNLGIWKNLSTSNLNSFSSLNGSDYGSFGSSNSSCNSGLGNGGGGSGASGTAAQATFQQHLESLLGKSEKKVLEEREQVLKKLRVLIRNGSIRWTGEFIKAGGPSALLQFCHHVHKSEESKLGQRERLLHQVVQCIKAIVSLEGGVDSLVKEPVFFSLMRTLAIHEAPVLTLSRSNEPTNGSKPKTGFFSGVSGSGSGSGSKGDQRSRTSSTPKPIQTRLGYFSPQHSPSLALTVDQIPTFSNSQSSVGILVAILAREPELRDQILKETVADPNPSLNQWRGGDDGVWKYTEWIMYLKEIIQICGIDIQSLEASSGIEDAVGQGGNALSSGKENVGRGKPTNATKVVSVGQGLSMLSQGPPGSTLSLFSLDNMRLRKNSGQPHAVGNASSSPMGAIKYEPGEDREVLAYLIAHLELVSKLIFDMHISEPGLAFAKSFKESQLEEYLERLRAVYIQNQDLSAQIEDLVIQLSMVPSTARRTAARLSRELPIVPAFESTSHQQCPSTQQSMQPTSPLLPSSPHHQHLQYQHQYPLSDAKYGAQVVPKATISEIPSRSSSLDLFAVDKSHVNSVLSNLGGGNAQRPVFGGLTRNPSQIKTGPMPQQQQQQPQPQQVGASRTRKAAIIGMPSDGRTSSPMGLNRQISSKRSSVDGYREISGGQYSPVPTEKQMSPMNDFYREESPLSRRTSTTTRRATIAESAPTASFVGSAAFQASAVPRFPVVPPKNKSRPVSMDAKGRSSDLLLPRIEYTKVKLDQQNNQYFRPTPSPPPQRQPAMDPWHASMPITPRASAEALAVPRSGSSNTFGHGRRSSLNNAGSITTKNSNGSFSINSDADSVAVPTSGLLSVPSAADNSHRDGGNSRSTDGSGTSTCSSTTSSGFTSNSSVSPPSTQTKRHSLVSTDTTVNLSTNSNSNIHGASSRPVSSAVTGLGPTRAMELQYKEVHQFRNVDFDTRIHNDVHKLASSSSNSRLRKTDSASSFTFDIPATDPKVLEAPIVVPEDLAMKREQYIQEQLSGIVLPPMQRKIPRESVSAPIDIEAITRRTRRASINNNNNNNSSGSGMSARSSTPSGAMFGSNSNQASKSVFFEQAASGMLQKPQLGGPTRRAASPAMQSLPPLSITPTGGRPTSPLSAGMLNNTKARISDRIRIFERT